MIFCKKKKTGPQRSHSALQESFLFFMFLHFSTCSSCFFMFYISFFLFPFFHVSSFPSFPSFSCFFFTFLMFFFLPFFCFFLFFFLLLFLIFHFFISLSLSLFLFSGVQNLFFLASKLLYDFFSKEPSQGERGGGEEFVFSFSLLFFFLLFLECTHGNLCPRPWLNASFGLDDHVRIIAREDWASLPLANARVITKSTRKIMFAFPSFLFFFESFSFLFFQINASSSICIWVSQKMFPS